MKAYRYCEGCGIGLGKEQWFRANHCSQCGTQIYKEEQLGSPLAGSLENSETALRSYELPESISKPLMGVGRAVGAHPILCSMGAVGAGVAGLMLAPLVLAAGQTIMMLGGVVGGVSLLAGFNSYDPVFKEGISLGVKMLGVGALVIGAGYVLLGASGLSVAGGLSLGVYTGTKLIIQGVRARQQLVKGQNLLEMNVADLP